jgi:outer membrane immunogenic protein
LIYASGGFAYGQVSTSVSALTTPTAYFAPFVDENRGTHSDVRIGWTLGAGVEYALTNSISIKGEYLYVDLGRKTSSAPAVGGALALFSGSTYTAADETRFHVVRGGLNVRFNTW